MRKGTITKSHQWIAIGVSVAALAVLAAGAMTDGVQITAGKVVMSMGVSPERGVRICFGSVQDETNVQMAGSPSQNTLSW